MGVPECDAVFLSALERAPPVPLVIEPSSHCRLLEEVVVSAACDAYAFEKKRKKKEWVSDLTLSFMNNRDHVLRMFQKRRRSLFNFELHAVFKCWSRGDFLSYSPVRGFGSRALLMKYYRAHTQLWYHNRHVAA